MKYFLVEVFETDIDGDRNAKYVVEAESAGDALDRAPVMGSDLIDLTVEISLIGDEDRLLFTTD